MPFRVTIGTKLLVTLLVVALVPAAITGWLAVGGLYQVGEIAAWESMAALEGQAKDRVRLLAVEMARRENIRQEVADTRIGDRGFAFLIDRSGTLIAAPSGRLQELGVDVMGTGNPPGVGVPSTINLYEQGNAVLRAALSEILAGQSGLREVNVGSEPKYLAYAQLPRSEWILVLALPVSEVLQPASETAARIESSRTDLLTRLAIIGGLLFVGVIIFASFAYRGLVAPIQRLMAGTRTIAAGDLRHRIPVTSSDEIGELATEFNVMAERLQELNAGLERKVAERTSELERRTEGAIALVEIARSFGGSLDLDNVLRQIAIETSRLLGVQRVAIFLHHPATDTIYARITYSAESQQLEEVRRRAAITLPAQDVPLWQELASTLRPLVIAEPSTDPRITHWEELAEPDDQTILEVPLVIGGAATGFISISETRQPREFNQAEILLAQSLAQHAAVAIENARLYRRELRRAEQFRTLNELGRRIGVIHSVDDLLPFTVKLLQDAFPYQRVQIFSVEGEWLVFRAGAYENDQIRLGALNRLRIGDRGIISWVAQTGMPLLANDVSQESRYLYTETLKDTRSELAVPIKLGDRVLGVLDVESKDLHAFEPADLTTAQAVADQIALALENARLIEAERRGREETGLVLEMTRAVGSSLQLDRVLQIAAEGIASAVGTANCGIYLLDEEIGQLIPQRGAGRLPTPEAEQAYFTTAINPEEDAFIREVFKTRRALISADARNDRRLNPDLVARLRLGALLAVPFVVRDQVAGLAVVTWFDEAHEFTPEQIALAEGIANSVALAIENARLYAQTHNLAVVEERNRLAREIHDTLAQSLTGIVLQLEAADQLFESKPERAQARLQKAIELARACLQEARRSVWNLRPAPLEEMSLAEAIRGEVRRFGSENGIEIDLVIDGEEGDLPPETEQGLFRMLQEALTNIRKHAQTRSAAVELTFGESIVTLIIRDNGVGFDDSIPAARTASGGFGLLGMRERARLIGGQINIESATDRGTVITIKVPRTRRPTLDTETRVLQSDPV